MSMNLSIAQSARPRFSDNSWLWPLGMVGARFGFALAAQAIVAGLYMLQGHASPWQAAAPWWTVYGTAIDIGCLLLIARRCRKEGSRLTELFGFDAAQAGRDMLKGIVYMAIFLPVAVAGPIIGSLIVYGNPEPPPIMGPLPLWAALYSLLVWPVLWAVTEQTTYAGFALPRFIALTGSRWQALAIVFFGWMLQHAALPFYWDWKFILFRFISFLPLIVMPLLYLRKPRLAPFIAAHWGMDFVAVLTGIVLR